MPLMETGISLSCFGDDDGGVTLRAATAQVELSMPLDHATALKTAASILLCAGVREASFSDGVLCEAR